MWFQFPEGTDRISVQLHEYKAEFTDDEGHQFFRAPDHFAPIILDLTGVKSVKQPAGAPEDLVANVSVDSSALSDLGAQVEALKLENEGLRAALVEVKTRYDDMRLKLHETTTELEILKAEPKPEPVFDKKK